MDYDKLYSEFNIGAAWQVCLGAEVRMRAEHTLEKKGKLEDKCAEHTTLFSEKDADIAHLKSLLSLKETEAVKAISLRSQLSVVETADAAKSTELRDLKEKNFALEGERNALSERLSRDELNSKVASLESKRDCLGDKKSSLESAFELFRERIEALQNEQAKTLGDRVVKLDAQLSKMAIHLSPEYLQALGQAIGCAVNKGIQDGLKAGIDHGKAGRDLPVLESKKDSSIVDLMDSLRLEGVLAEIPGAENLQPSPKQLMLPIHRPEDNVVFAETSLSSSLEIVNLRVQRFRKEAKEKRLSLTDVMTLFVKPLSLKSLTGEASTSATPITTLSTTFASSVVIPPSSVVSDQVLDAEPHNEDPPAVTFEKEELSTSPE
ncbi:hypothetical protein Tco_0307266 [Tanacetum coccineum]